MMRDDEHENEGAGGMGEGPVFFNHVPMPAEIEEAALRAFRTGQADPGSATDNWLSGYVQALYDREEVDEGAYRDCLQAVADGAAARGAVAFGGGLSEVVNLAYEDALAEKVQGGEYDTLMADLKLAGGGSPEEYCSVHGVEVGGSAWKSAAYDIALRASEAAVRDYVAAWSEFMVDWS